MPPGPIRQWSASETERCVPGVAGRDPALDALSTELDRLLNGPQFQLSTNIFITF